MRRRGVLGAVVTAVAGAASVAASHALSEAAPQERAQLQEPVVTNADAIKGTWVVQQAASAAELNNAMEAWLDKALATPDVVGFSHRVTWSSIDADFSLLQQGYEIATARGLLYAPRFMAGRHTPARVFEAGCPSYPRPETGEKVPCPFNPDGSPNTIFESEWTAFVGQLATWCRERGGRLLHLPWYGQDWAELNNAIAVRNAPGYSYASWLTGHKRLLDLAFAHTGPDLAVEFPFSGAGPLSGNSMFPAARDLAAHVVDTLGACDSRFFCQANGLGPDAGPAVSGDWGAPNVQTETAFDADVWPKPVYRGQQMIQPFDYPNWNAIFQHVYGNSATYCEVYAQSFYGPSGTAQPHLAELQAEVSAFKSHVSAATPKPPGCA